MEMLHSHSEEEPITLQQIYFSARQAPLFLSLQSGEGNCDSVGTWDYPAEIICKAAASSTSEVNNPAICDSTIRLQQRWSQYCEQFEEEKDLGVWEQLGGVMSTGMWEDEVAINSGLK